MEYQLRDYQVTPGALDEWLVEWREQVYPLRLARGFEGRRSLDRARRESLRFDHRP